jgi:uncharacterized membrane protein
LASYRILLSLHILAVVVGLGVTFALPFLQAFAERQGVGPTRFVLRFSRRLDKFVVWPGAALVFLFGLGLVFSDQTGYKDDMPAWLTISIVWYLAAVALAIFVLRPTVDKALASLESSRDDGPLPAAYQPYSKRIQMLGGILGLSVVGIAIMMVFGRTDAF